MGPGFHSEVLWRTASFVGCLIRTQLGRSHIASTVDPSCFTISNESMHRGTIDLLFQESTDSVDRPRVGRLVEMGS